MLVEVVYGDAKQQTLLSCDVTADATVGDAIVQSGILQHYPELELQTLKVGIFSKKVDLVTKLNPQDRIEIYRPLTIDPKDARRLRVKK